MPSEPESMMGPDDEFVLGGCVIEPDSADWTCRDCGNAWQDEQVSRNESVATSRVRCPVDEIPINELLSFALTYNAYWRLADSPDSLQEVVKPVLSALDR